jgi:hypothetical protein
VRFGIFLFRFVVCHRVGHYDLLVSAGVASSVSGVQS